MKLMYKKQPEGARTMCSISSARLPFNNLICAVFIGAASTDRVRAQTSIKLSGKDIIFEL